MNPGIVSTGLGTHVIRGLGCIGLAAMSFYWFPWIQSAENGMQSILYCATETALSEQSGLYYSDCSVQLTSDKAAKAEDAYRLYEMSERMAGLTS